jgi:hypothetical protein
MEIWKDVVDNVKPLKPKSKIINEAERAERWWLRKVAEIRYGK